MACRFLLIQFDLTSQGGEVSNIKLNNIDNFSRSLRLYDTKNGEDVIKPISPVAMLLISQQEEFLRAERTKNKDGLLFPNRKGGPISYGDMADICTERALTNPGFHSPLNRGGFVTRGCQLGVSEQDLMNQMGHLDARSLGARAKVWLRHMTSKVRLQPDISLALMGGMSALCSASHETGV